VDTLWRDLRYAVRSLTRSPGFTLVAVVALCLGIGANTAIFSLVNAVILRPLPYPDSDRLVRWSWQFEEGEIGAVTALEFDYWKDHSDSFDAVMGYSGISSGFNLAGGSDAMRVRGVQVSEGFFRVLGISPAIGRAFTKEEDRFNGPLVTIISDGLWRNYLGRDPDVIGKQLLVNGQSRTIVGVLPRGFHFELPVELLLPLQSVPDVRDDGQNTGVIARLRRGTSLEQAHAEMQRLLPAFRQQFPNHIKPGDRGIGLTSYQQFLVGDVQSTLWLLFGAVAFVLMIACANVANLLLERGARREGEIAIRIALGASRWRLMRQLLIESWSLALAGSLAGLLLALWGVPALLAFTPRELPRIGEISLDYQAILFAMAASFLTSLLFGVFPAMRATHVDVSEAIKASAGRNAAGRSDSRMRGMLVVGEVALSLVLLVGAGLLVKSFVNLLDVDLGFNVQHLTAARISLASQKYRTASASWEFQRQVLERLASTPGVSSVAAASNVPLERGLRMGIAIDGHQIDKSVQIRSISPRYFETLQINVDQGRQFADGDMTAASQEIMVNQTLVRTYLHDRDPIGASISVGGRPRLIVGVANDIKEMGLDRPVEPTVYMPVTQLSDGLTAAMNGWFLTGFLVRTSGPVDLTTAMRAAVNGVDSQMPVADVRPMKQVMGESIASRRFVLMLMSVFAALALVLTAVGLYGVLSYQVSRRTNEIGVRMALGAQPRDVLVLVIGKGMALAGFGIIIGLAASVGLTRLLAGWLFGVSATDPMMFVLIAGVLMGVALLACYVPARKATHVDPIAALHYE
jgi:putative ABC transport system permease protein